MERCYAIVLPSTLSAESARRGACKGADGLDSGRVVVAANLRDRDLGEQILQDRGDGDVAQGDAFANKPLFTEIVNDKRVNCPSSSDVVPENLGSSRLE